MSDFIGDHWPKLTAFMGTVFGAGIAWGSQRYEQAQQRKEIDDFKEVITDLRGKLNHAISEPDCDKCKEESRRDSERTLSALEDRVVKALSDQIKSSERRMMDFVQLELKSHSSVLKSLVLRTQLDDDDKDAMLSKMMR